MNFTEAKVAEAIYSVLRRRICFASRHTLINLAKEIATALPDRGMSVAELAKKVRRYDDPNDARVAGRY